MHKNNTKSSLNPVFNFNANHNVVDCIESLNPKDRGTERQYWFTAKMLCTIYEESKQTVGNNIKSLLEDEEVCQNSLTDAQILDSTGVPHPVTLYNLEVLNKLGMCCFRGNKKAREIRNKFNDVLVKSETSLSTPQTYLEALKALVIAVEEKERAEMQAQFEAEQKQLALEQRDRAIATKAYFVEGRDAEMCGRVGGLTKANTDLRQKNTQLETENNELKIQVGDAENLKAVKSLKWTRDFFYYVNKVQWNTTLGCIGKEIKKICEANNYEYRKIPDSNWGEVWAYDIRAIEIFRSKLISDKHYMRKFRKDKIDDRSLFSNFV